MTYDPRPNASGDTLVDSRDPIRINFEVIRDAFVINHQGFNATNEGKHKFVQMPNQDTIPASAANEVTVFAQDSGSVSQLHIRGEGTGSTYQLTTTTSGVDPDFATFGTNTGYIANHTGGWTFLPGGLIMQYGARSTPGKVGVITFPRTFPTAYFSITMTMSRNASSSTQSVSVDNAVATVVASFAYRGSSSNTDPIYWTAIGN